MSGIGLHIAGNDHGCRAESQGRFGRHGRMDAGLTRFVTARGHYAPVAMAADEDGQSPQFRAAEQFDGDEKSVEIEVENSAVEQGENLKQILLIFGGNIKQVVCYICSLPEELLPHDDRPF